MFTFVPMTLTTVFFYYFPSQLFSLFLIIIITTH